MPIADPTAIPETPEEVTEYTNEAERLWNDGRTEEAHVLYRSLFNARGSNNSLAAHRLVLYLQSIGDINGALDLSIADNEPGAEDLRVALRGAMPDQVVDPSNPPQTQEACDRYYEAVLDAGSRGDWVTVDALCLAYQQTSVDVGLGRHASTQWRRGEALVHLGRNDEARPCLEYAIANTASDETARSARQLLQQIGVDVQDGGNPYDTDDSRAMVAGIAAFEGGDLATATTQLEAVVSSSTATDQDKGRAHFYLGSIGYHSHHYQEARTHLHTAQTDAPEPERTWAADMLSWRWQE
jgi:tetratricopeptide (TPR) repeat protein